MLRAAERRDLRYKRGREFCAAPKIFQDNLTMRLSDAEVRHRQTEPLNPNHRSPPWFTEDAPRDRSNRLLGFTKNLNHCADRDKLGSLLYAPSGASLNGFLNAWPMEKFNRYLVR